MELEGYDENKMLRMFHLVFITLLVMTFIVPTALLSYRVVSYPVGVAIVLTFCVFFIGLAIIIEPDKPGMQLFLVLAYGAIATGILSNFQQGM